ncbi:hypothetical protein Btru_016866 [Bulinus truncatus]|nr:hypothetical protein Btru_016866 [Bulinus truncatus]
MSQCYGTPDHTAAHQITQRHTRSHSGTPDLTCTSQITHNYWIVLASTQIGTMGPCYIFLMVTLAAFSNKAASQPNEISREVWNITDFPDPSSPDEKERLRCGRQSTSSVCNPNNIITKIDADAIDNLINIVHKETRCPCNDCHKYKHGYSIRVAVINSFEKFNKKNSQQSLLREAKLFSYLLSQKWKMQGACDETLLILYSKKDNLLFTMTRKTARMKLHDSDVGRISLAVRTYFDNPSTIGDGIIEMIRRYRLIFDGKHDEAFHPLSVKKS